jgi:MFS family permease
MQFLPILLLGVWGGSVADRVDRRRLIIAAQVAQALLAVVLGVLALTGLVEVWMVYALALALGFVTVFDSPARQAFISELVQPEDYVNANALNSAVHNGGRLVGPALAGIVIGAAGVGTAFIINALSFVAVLIGLMRLDLSKLVEVPRSTGGQGHAREGVRYAWTRRELRLVLVLVFVLGVFGQNFRVVLPVLAQDTFQHGAQAYGYLTAMLGLGAVLGSLYSASRELASSWTMLLSCIAFAVASLATAASPTLLAAYLIMIPLGFTNILFNTLARTVLQLRSEMSMHGRVLGLHSLLFLGSTVFGAPLLGLICDVAGARVGIAVGGGTALVVALLLLPSFRRLRAPTEATS